MTELSSQCVVYMAINMANGKFYVGATEKGLRDRRSRHLWNARTGRPGIFYNAIRKHGADRFHFTVYKECGDFWEALEEERKLIAQIAPPYNMTDGGGGVKGFKFSEESRKKMSLAKLGKPGHPNPPGHIEKLRAISMARKGKPISVKATEVFRENVKRAIEKRRKPVRCTTDGKEFASTSDASRFYGLTSGQVTMYCRKKFKSRRGLEFEYINKDTSSV